MYFAAVILLLLILPIGSIAAETILSHHALSLTFLAGKWFVFWAAGIRLFIAGVRQIAQPEFTASDIFGIRDSQALPIVREVGFANLSMGLLGISSLLRSEWVVPAAIVGGMYYGLAGAGHVSQKNKNNKEYLAMFSDAFVFIVLLVFVLKSLV
jgi:hypothetical protein